MFPYLKEGDIVFFKKYKKNKSILKNRQIVIFNHPIKNKYLIKRINSVNQNNVEVIGDNIEFSEDSNKFGLINNEKIIGIVTSKLIIPKLKNFLIQNNLTDFEKLSNLSDLDINEIQRKSSLCTLNNLKKIRAIAIFKKEIGISPPQAYLLLHCGISSLKSLSLSTPYELERKISRLERILRVKTETDTTFTLLKEWIKKASQIDKSI